MKKSLFLAIVAAIAISTVSCKPKQSAYKAAYEKATVKDQEEEVVEEAPVRRTPPTSTRPTTSSTATTTRERVTAIDGQLKLFSVVIGSFANKTNAERLKSEMIGKGYKALLALNEERQMYRVLIATFDEKSEASQKRDQVKSIFAPKFQDAWILEREF